jgi:cytochrome P450
MNTDMGRDDNADLPVFPGVRSQRCPLDPPSTYADWRVAAGLQRVRLWNGNAAWAVSRFEDVRAVLSDPRMSADARRFPAVAFQGVGQDQPQGFPRMDDPEHGRVRRMLIGDFTVRQVEKLRPQIQTLVNEFLERMISKGQPTDLVREYALPIPSMVISLLLGVPYEDHEFLQQQGAIVNSNTSAEKKEQANWALFGYLSGLVARKEQEPGEDIITRLLQVQVANGELTREEVAMNSMILLVSGHETTANMISLSTVALLRHPDQAARVRDTDDPAVVANAVEELLRYLTIAQDATMRVATEDLTIAGQLVKAGDLLTINFPAANRDPAFFTDPDTLDIDRKARGHVAFGYGAHQCLGPNLARLELQIALPTLLRRLPGLRLTLPLEQMKFRHDMSAYGVYELPVAW